MPRRDGTGPMGIGPITGRGNGFGNRVGQGNGRGMGNGNGCGLGFRNRQGQMQGQLQKDELTLLKEHSQKVNDRIAELEKTN